MATLFYTNCNTAFANTPVNCDLVIPCRTAAKNAGKHTRRVSYGCSKIFEKCSGWYPTERLADISGIRRIPPLLWQTFKMRRQLTTWITFIGARNFSLFRPTTFVYVSRHLAEEIGIAEFRWIVLVNHTNFSANDISVLCSKDACNQRKLSFTCFTYCYEKAFTIWVIIFDYSRFESNDFWE